MSTLRRDGQIYVVRARHLLSPNGRRRRHKRLVRRVVVVVVVVNCARPQRAKTTARWRTQYSTQSQSVRPRIEEGNAKETAFDKAYCLFASSSSHWKVRKNRTSVYP
jgi:hypothetical protein